MNEDMIIGFVAGVIITSAVVILMCNHAASKYKAPPPRHRCPHCGEGEMLPIMGVAPYSVDHYQCSICNSTSHE